MATATLPAEPPRWCDHPPLAVLRRPRQHPGDPRTGPVGAGLVVAAVLGGSILFAVWLL